MARPGPWSLERARGCGTFEVRGRPRRRRRGAWSGTLVGLATLVMVAGAWAVSADTTDRSPVRSLQALIDATETGGTLVLEPGEYRGPVTIDRPLTVQGEVGARVVGGGEGSVITVEADGVHLEGLVVRRSGRDLSKDDAGILILGDDVTVRRVRLEENLHGIYVRAGQRVELRELVVVGLAATEEEPEVIGTDGSHSDDGMHHSPPSTRSLMGNGVHLFDADGVVVADNVIHHVRDGIYVAHTNGAEIRGNRVHDSRYGIHYMYSSGSVVAGNELWANVAGPALMFSRDLEVVGNVLHGHSGFRAYGLLLQNVDASVIRENQIRGNRVGMRLQNSNANDFSENRIVGNLAGTTITSSSRDNRLTRNEFGLNLRQLELTGPAPPAEWSVDGVGNDWSGALPLDLTGDGVSNWPHHEVDLTAGRRERFPEVDLLIGSVGVRVLEWALSRAPVPGTRHITDPHPLIHTRARGRR